MSNMIVTTSHLIVIIAKICVGTTATKMYVYCRITLG